MNDSRPDGGGFGGRLHRHGARRGGVWGARAWERPSIGFESGNLAAQFNGTDSSIAIPPLAITTTNFTITGWVKRNGPQNNWSGLVFTRSSGRGVGVMVVNNALRFGWNDDGIDYNWNSGLALADGQWTFFALTIEPARAVLYRATDATLQFCDPPVANNPLTISSSFSWAPTPTAVPPAGSTASWTKSRCTIAPSPGRS